MFNPELRLMPMTTEENEWRYLVNETFIGEKCIIPLLQQVLNDDIIYQSEMKAEIERQLFEEINHVRIYYKLVGQEKLSGSEYDKEFFNYVSSLKSPTLKLFALQGMLEGIALGALEYRSRIWERSPSKTSDYVVKKEEEGHTTLSYPFFKQLIKNEGLVSQELFKEVAKNVNKVFVECFSGAVLKNYVEDTDRQTEWSPKQFEETPAINFFRKQSALIVSKNRRQFLNQYSEAGQSV